MARKRKAADNLILVRSTVNQHGLKAGRMAWVDPTEPWIEKALASQFLIKEEPLPDEKPPEEIPAEE